jgi:DNA repair photolyase
MKIIKKEIRARSVLSTTGIPGIKYCVNPYIGCAHSCVYCYATFMKKFTGHTENWGSFVDIKMNASEVLRGQLKSAKKGGIILSSVTDPYQPVEASYRITRKCLKTLALFHLPVSILTKSPLVLRDIDVISQLEDADVGITMSTDNDRIRRIFEPCAPSVKSRREALKKLHQKGLKTYVFIGPILPMDTERLARMVRPYADRVLVDRMNYSWKVAGMYKKYGLGQWLQEDFINNVIFQLQRFLSGKNIEIC